MASIATGVVNPLVGKLYDLLEKKHSMLKSVRDDISFMKDELSSINALLVNLSNMDDLDVETKEWRNQVRELAYDIDDCIDDFMLRVDHGPDVKGSLQKIIHDLKKLKARFGITKKIQKLKDRVEHVSKRHERYKFDGAISTSSIDPRLAALYADAKSLVGMDGPRDELIQFLTQGEGESVQKLRVVSIVGFGGLGKTTLAKQVYDNLTNEFNCRAFVSVSQKPDWRKLLNKLLEQLKGQPSPVCEEKDAIDELRDYLLDKRYFIIIDDLWSEPAWNFVKLSFPENNHGSRIITTTRNETVARACCIYRHEYIYKMKSLDDQDSRKLFFNRIFGSDDGCPPQFKQYSADILKKCGGLPLAVITIGSLLAIQATEPNKQWEYVINYLDATVLETNPTLEGMRQILNLSYMDLSCPLKTCFLYLCICPEDYLIGVDDLVKQWIAEGFVDKKQGRDVEEVARSYFNELVRRSMVQLDFKYIGISTHCRLHDMILDLIRCKAREENFITTVDNPQGMTQMYDKVRRLSQRSGDEKYDTISNTINLSKIRLLADFSLTVDGDNTDKFPLLKFKRLRVLYLDVWITTNTSTLDFTGMCQLFQLRYFKVTLTISGASLKLLLPNQICGLQHLETFEIDYKVRRVFHVVRKDLRPLLHLNAPRDICHLPHLLHLQIGKMPDGIGDMRSLRTLKFSLTTGNIKDLGKLTNLRSLGIMFPEGFNWTEYMDALCSSLRKIVKCNLEDLTLIYLGAEIVCSDGLNCLSSASHSLQRLDLFRLQFSRLPEWIGKLHWLHSLAISIQVLLEDDVRILAQLPALIRLRLFFENLPEERIFIHGIGFPVLKAFALEGTMYVAFEAGAMPKLDYLETLFFVKEVEQYGPTLVG